MTTRTHRGQIALREFGEHDDALFLGDTDEPLAQTIQRDRDKHGPYATVRYFVSDEERSADQLNDDLISVALGEVDVKYHSHYSEFTGYLWTDEELRVGGHNLMAEFQRHEGMWLHMEIRWTRGPDRNGRS